MSGKQTYDRCIGFRDHRRCPNRCAKRQGDLMLCCSHSLFYEQFVDQIRPTTRAVLARSHWETRAEGMAIINRINSACERQAS